MATIYAKDLNDLYWRIMDVVKSGTRRNGRRIFQLSQATEDGFVPVRTGRLKRSGHYIGWDDHYIIKYTAPYAANVELGYNEEGGVNRTVYVKPYFRKAYRDKHGNFHPARIMPGYHRTVDSHKEVDVNWHTGHTSKRRIKVRRKRKGQRFLSRAFSIRILEIGNDIRSEVQ